MAADKVKVSGSLYLPWIRVDSKETTPKSEFTAKIRVEAAPLLVRSNAFPIHLVVVLDVVSGTMGQRATGPRFDLLKMMEFIKGELVHGDATQHKVDVVTTAFADSMPIDRWISTQRKQENPMRKARAADLKPVLERTHNALEKERESSVGRVSFIILVSDGESKFEGGFEKKLRGYPVHAFGLGKNHDPKVLYRIAKTSGGTYSSVPVADTDTEAAKLNNSKLVMEAMALCLGGLKSVVAIDTCVKISVPNDTATQDTLIIQELKIVKIQSGDHKMKIEEKEGEICVGVLYAGEVKDFIVRLQFKSTKSGNGRTRSAVLTAAVEYKYIYMDISSKQQQQQQQHSPKCQVRLLVTSSHDDKAIKAYEDLKQQAPNSRVLQQMIFFEVVETLLSFAKEEEEAKAKAEAKTSTNTNNDVNVAGNMRERWEGKLRSLRNLRMARENDLVDLQRIDEVMAAMVTNLEGGSGLGCIYSWVSSYQMQRATTTGLPVPPPPPFLTPAMEEAARKVSKLLVAQQASRRQSAITLLEELEQLFDKWDNSRRRNASTLILETLNFGKEVHEAVKAAINGGTRTTTTTSGSGAAAATQLDDDLKDDIKSTIAIWMFDCFIKLKKSSYEDDLPKIYEFAEVAVNYWRRVQAKSLPAPAAAETPWGLIIWPTSGPA